MEWTNEWIEEGKAQGLKEGVHKGLQEGRLELLPAQVDAFADAVDELKTFADAKRWLNQHR